MVRVQAPKSVETGCCFIKAAVMRVNREGSQLSLQVRIVQNSEAVILEDQVAAGEVC